MVAAMARPPGMPAAKDVPESLNTWDLMQESARGVYEFSSYPCLGGSAFNPLVLPALPCNRGRAVP